MVYFEKLYQSQSVPLRLKKVGRSEKISHFIHISPQGRTEKLKLRVGQILIKMKSFCEILDKMSHKEGGGRRTVAPTPSVSLCPP